MLFTAFNSTNKAFLFSPSLLLTSHDTLSTPFLYPLPYFTLFITAKTAKYIIRPLIAVTLTHLSTPSLFIHSSIAVPPSLSSSQACWHRHWAALKWSCLFNQPEMWLCAAEWGVGGLCLGGPNVKALQQVFLCFSFEVFWTFVEAPSATEVQFFKMFRQCGIRTQWLPGLTVRAALCFTLY